MSPDKERAERARRAFHMVAQEVDTLRKEQETLKGLLRDYLSMPSCDGRKGRQVLRAELSSRIGGTYDEKKHIFMDKENT